MKGVLIVALLVNAALLAGRIWQELPAARAGVEPPPTKNGDVNGDGRRDVTDAVALLHWLFRGGPEPVAIAAEPPGVTPEQLDILGHMSIVELPIRTDDDGNVLETATTIRITGVNLQIVNGLGATNGRPENQDPRTPAATNGLGNLIVGYQERRVTCLDAEDCSPEPILRTGSHNLIVGQGHEYTGLGGLVAGLDNTVSAPFACVSGGFRNAASGELSSVSGGGGNRALSPCSSVSGGRNNAAGDDASRTSGIAASVSGGFNNRASNSWSSVSGGRNNVASGLYAAVSAGESNTAGAWLSSVSGGRSNQAAVDFASVSGGRGNTASGSYASISGGEANLASGPQSSVSGGYQNTASGIWSSVSGGQANTASGHRSSVSGGGGVAVQGHGNTAAGDYSTVSGGRGVVVNGEAGHQP